MSRLPKAPHFAHLLVLAALVLTAAGCAGPHYAGGPTSDQPHGRIDAGGNVSIWEVDGYATTTRSGIYVEPGMRKIKVRVEFPIDHESATPFEKRDMSLRVEAGHLYTFYRKGDGKYPPFEVGIREERPR